MSSTIPTAFDIAQSLNRLQRNFQGYYGNNPILEDDRPIGSITEDQRRIYVTFRGSVNSLWEILSCLDIRKQTMEPIHLSGKVHSGIFQAFLKVHAAVLAKIQALGTEREIVIEGYSRGSTIAFLIAAYLRDRLPGRQITVWTYSSMKIFDRVAAEEYLRKVSSTFSFFCQEDWIPSWAPSSLGFVKSGNQITFSARGLPNYEERVQQRTYLHLLPGIIGSLLKCLIPARRWEAHMPETYREGAPASLLTFSQNSQRLHN